MNYLKSLIIALLSRIPFLKALSPIWKPLVIKLIQEQGDELQKKLIEQVSLYGPGVIDKNVDQWQEDIKKLSNKIPLPNYVKLRILDFIDSHADKMQEQLKVSLNTQGLPAMSLAFDSLQKELIAKLNLL